MGGGGGIILLFLLSRESSCAHKSLTDAGLSCTKLSLESEEDRRHRDLEPNLSTRRLITVMKVNACILL